MANRKIKSWFHYYSTKEAFDLHLNNGLINPNSICFIEETSQLYTQNQLFGVAKSDFLNAIAKIKEHEKSLRNMLGIEGDSTEGNSIDNIKEIVAFLKGISNEKVLQEMLEEMKNSIRVTESAVSAIQNLYGDEFLSKLREFVDIILVESLQPVWDMMNTMHNEHSNLINELYSRNSELEQSIGDLTDNKIPKLTEVIYSQTQAEGEAAKQYTRDEIQKVMDLIHQYHP